MIRKNSVRLLVINIIFIATILVLVMPFAISIYSRLYLGQWPEWSGFGPYQLPADNFQREKTFWDWLQLILVPSMLAVVAVFFNLLEGKTERAIEQERSCEAALQSYLDHMTDLLRKSEIKGNKFNESRAIARARTLTTLRALDGERRGIVIRFLYEAGLLSGKSALDLKGACLVDADLMNTDLRGASLNGVDLTDSQLSNSILQNASLEEAQLIRANLSNSDLYKANLTGAVLAKANLLKAILDDAILDASDMSKAKVLELQLAKSKSLEGIIMPNGKKQR